MLGSKGWAVGGRAVGGGGGDGAMGWVAAEAVHLHGPV